VAAQSVASIKHFLCNRSHSLTAETVVQQFKQDVCQAVADPFVLCHRQLQDKRDLQQLDIHLA